MDTSGDFYGFSFCSFNGNVLYELSRERIFLKKVSFLSFWLIFTDRRKSHKKKTIIIKIQFITDKNKTRKETKITSLQI